MNVCRHCGAEYTAGVNAACRDCRLAPDPSATPSLPDPDTLDDADGDGPDELAFDLAAWPAEDRVAVGVAIGDQGVPWRWEPGPVLVVREADEAIVEAILDEAEGGGEGDAPWEEVREDAGDEESQNVMSDLFLAGDRLMRSPWNGELVVEVGRLATVVEESKPPFGVERAVWDQIGALAAAVAGAGEQGDDVGVEDASRALRDFLREYV